MKIYNGFDEVGNSHSALHCLLSNNDGWKITYASTNPIDAIFLQQFIVTNIFKFQLDIIYTIENWSRTISRQKCIAPE